MLVLGFVRAPFSKRMDMLLKLVGETTWLNQGTQRTGDDFSVIISARNEDVWQL